jgi:heptosyltransferase II
MESRSTWYWKRRWNWKKKPAPTENFSRGEHFMTRGYENILIHCLVNIGDVVLSTAAVALLRKTYPHAKITMMVRPAAAEIARNNPVVDEVLVFDYTAKKKSLSATFRFSRELAAKKFDICISLDRKLRPALLAFLARIPVRIGPDRVFDDKPSLVTKLYTRIVRTPLDFRHTHQADIFKSIVRGFTGVDGDADPVIGKVMPEHSRKAEMLLSRLPEASRRIALCVKGTYPTKNWPPANFAALLEHIAVRYGAAQCIVGAPEDWNYAEEILTGVSAKVLNFCGETTLLELAALLAKVDLFITIDTGAMHIGATVQVPIIGIFRCVSVDRWRPLTRRTAILSNPLAQCPDEGPPESCPQHYCVADIPLAQAIAAVEEMLPDSK